MLLEMVTILACFVSKLDLKLNLNKLFPVKCNCSRDSTQLLSDKLKLKFRKFDGKKKEREKQMEILLHHSSLTFFLNQLNIAFRIRPLT